MDRSDALIILGLPPSATPAQIKEAYRDLAKVWHPDRLGSDPRLRAKGEDKLEEVNEAYDVLRIGGASHQARPTSSSSRNYGSTSAPRTDPHTESESERPPAPTSPIPPPARNHRTYNPFLMLYTAYRDSNLVVKGCTIVMAVCVIVLGTMAAISFVLHLFGIRWGW